MLMHGRNGRYELTKTVTHVTNKSLRSDTCAHIQNLHLIAVCESQPLKPAKEVIEHRAKEAS